MPSGNQGTNAIPSIEEMAEMRRAGSTLQEIGDRHDITRERVRQLLAGKGIDEGAVRAARRATRLAVARKSGPDIVRLWRAGGTSRTIGQSLDLPASDCSEIIETQATELDAAARRKTLNQRSGASIKQYSDEELISAVRRVARNLGRAPSTADYEHLAKEYGLPSAILIVNRLGWSNAVKAAGLEPLGRRRAYTRRWTEDACITAVCAVASELGHVPSVQEYGAFSRGKSNLPSVATVRNRVGGWAEVRGRVALLLRI